MKRYFLAILFLFVLQFFLIHVCHFDGRWFLMSQTKAEEADNGFTEDTISPVAEWPDSGIPLPAEPNAFAGVQKNSISKKLADKYVLKMYYPSFGNKELDASIKAWATKYCDKFAHDAIEDYDKNKDAFIKWNLAATYSIAQSGPNAISVLFRIYQYTGGGHGQFDYITRTFDKNTWQEIPHEKFFTDQDKALVILSKYCRATLAKRDGFADIALKAGTSPIQDNYDIIAPLPKGLLVVFHGGQISSMAEGHLTVFVPLEEFRDCVEPGKIWQ